jgi:hypothetical protein
LTQFTSINVRLATPEDKHLPAFDNTKLVALDTCTRWGILTYQMHKVWPGSKKSQALSAGVCLHEAFSAIRLWQLYWYDLGPRSETTDAILDNQGKRIFGSHRWLNFLQECFATNTREALVDFVYQVLHTSDYDEDPADKKRSMSAIEESALNYINKYQFTACPIWVRDKNDPNTDVGIEIAFELVIEFTYKAYPPEEPHFEKRKCFRFTGKLDGLYIDPSITNADLSKGALVVEDDKTTSRITDNWSEGYQLDTQTVGYMLAAKVFTNQDCSHFRIKKVSLPVPAKSTHGGISVYRSSKPDYMFTQWFDWFYNLADTAKVYEDRPIEAPISPHSCIRYFKPCSMLPFCVLSKPEQVEAIPQFETYEWNVLEGAEDSE